MAFVSSSNNSSTNRTVNTIQAVNTSNGVSTASTQVNVTNIDNLSDAIICAFLASQPDNSPQLVHEDLEQIHPDDMEKMDLRWQMAMLTIRARSLVSCDGVGGYDWSDQLEEGPNYALMAYTSSSYESKDKGVIDSGCSRHMTGNISYLIDYEEIDEGYVAFGGNPKGGKITRKCTIKTATKDETSGILKSFITGIENLVHHKVKVIRCDNRTEFKNKEMNQFCKVKGIKRQFSVARTPQQNRVAKRRNMILVKAAMTILADSKLPTTFWEEAVNIACYV
nr:ribonuclease H-like domain-containing protein [Tanacetum cinerariifolium]